MSQTILDSKLPYLLGFLFSSFLSMAQNPTIGLILDTPDAFEGYTLISASSATETHLIDNCGRVMNQWESEYRMGGSCYLLEDGSLLRTARLNSDTFFGGGRGGRLERYAWSGELEWSYDYASDSAHHHHDMAVLPNGNILILAWEFHSNSEAQELGRIGDENLWPPQIIEITPMGVNGAEIVWEWHAWDHLIQNINPSLPNFGEPSDFPNRFDINYEGPTGVGPMSSRNGDWFHCNAIHYNASLDQIMLNSRRWNEFYILDHSTSSDEAASSAGGSAGRGGDLLYRWGNPEAYGRGGNADQRLFGPHDAHWLQNEEGTTDASPSASVLIFNNGTDRPGGPRSSVDELTLPLQPDGTYLLSDGAAYGPSNLDWWYPTEDTPIFFSPFISGAQRLPNGNTLICEGDDGRIFEINPEGEIVWEYITATSQFGPNTQGNEPFENATFRAYRYGFDFAGFQDEILHPGEPVELNPYASDCDTASDDSEIIHENLPLEISFGPNPFSDVFRIESKHPLLFTLFDMMGRPILQGSTLDKSVFIWSHLPNGSYVLKWADTSENTGSSFILKK